MIIRHTFMTLEEKLETIGFRKNEAKVYLSVLKLGESAVGQVEKDAGLHKQLVYNAVEGLSEKGLLTVSEVRGRKRFSVSHPESLEDRAREQLTLTREIVSELFALANNKKTEDKIRTYRGASAIHQYYLERVRAQSAESPIHIQGINSERYFEIFDPAGVAWKRFENERISKQIVSQILLYGNTEKEKVLNHDRRYVDMRSLGEGVQAPMDIVIWDTSVGMLYYADEPYILDVAGKDVVDGHKGYFTTLLETATKIG